MTVTLSHMMHAAPPIHSLQCQDLQPPQPQDFCMVYTKECFLLHSIIEAVSPWPVDIKDVTFNYVSIICILCQGTMSTNEICEL